MRIFKSTIVPGCVLGGLLSVLLGAYVVAAAAPAAVQGNSGVFASGTGATGPTSTTDPPARPLVGKVVTIDPGHNGANHRYPGRINKRVDAGGFRKACDTTGTTTADGRLTEAAFNFDVAKRLRSLLSERGAKVVFTRPNNRGVGPCIDRRAEIGNDAASDVAISIHADGGPPGGAGFHVIQPAAKRASSNRMRSESHRLALAIRRALLAADMRAADYVGRNGLDTRADLGGLNLSTVPKVFVELGNMRNRVEQRHLRSRVWRQRAAQALATGIERRLVP